MKCALIHDWLLTFSGAEKVLQELCYLYPGPIYTLLKDEKNLTNSFFANQTIYASSWQKLPYISHYFRALLLAFPKAMESFDLSSYSLLFSSSHAIAKSVIPSPTQLHLCYCHTPMRYIWDLADFYLSTLTKTQARLVKLLFRSLQTWDITTANRVHHFIANSTYIAGRIQRAYGREATVIHPPIDTEFFTPSSAKEDYYFLCSRLVAYKRVDLLLSAFSYLPHKKLVIVGEGPDRKALEKRAGKNVVFLGYQPQEVLKGLLSKAKAFLFAGVEDFGMAMAEAQSAGIPVIAYGQGGSCDIVIEGKTGLLFKEQTEKSLVEAILHFEQMQDSFDPLLIHTRAKKFSKERFQLEIQEFVSKKYQQHLLRL